MTEVTRNAKRWTLARRAVQTLALVLFAAPVLVAGWSLFGGSDPVREAGNTVAELPFFGTLSSSSVGPVTLVDPFAALQVVAASKSLPLDMLLGTLPVLVVYGLIRGRAFCGWVCPVNFLLEGVDWLRAKLGIRVKDVPLPGWSKPALAGAVLVLSALVSVPVFEILNPVSAINKLVVVGSTAGLVTLVAVVLLELFWGHRVWCRSLCPLGGFYQVLGTVGLVNVKCNAQACIHCGKCQKVCLCAPEVLEPAVGKGAEPAAAVVTSGDCMLCGKCVEACPTCALHVGLGRK